VSVDECGSGIDFAAFVCVRVTGAACYFSDTIEWLAAYQTVSNFTLFSPQKRSLQLTASHSRCCWKEASLLCSLNLAAKKNTQQHPLKIVSLAHPHVIGVDVQTKFEIFSHPLFCLKELNWKISASWLPPPFALCRVKIYYYNALKSFGEIAFS
jgi:hypothetical protein